MKLNAEEISSVLRAEIEKYESQVDKAQEKGRDTARKHFE